MEINTLLSLMGLILVVIAVMANAYWQDAVRWEQQRIKALIAEDDDLAKSAEKYSNGANYIFKAVAFLGMLLLFSLMFLLVNPDSVFVITITRLILLPVLSALSMALAFYVIARKHWYFSPIGWHSKHLQKVISMEKKVSGLPPR